MTSKSISAFMLLALLTFIGCERSPQRVFFVENATEVERVDEALIITRLELESWFGQLPADKIPILISRTGDTIASQADDLTGNGQWDELFFLLSLESASLEELTLLFVDMADMPDFITRSNIRFARITDKGEYEEITAITRPPITSERQEETSSLFQFEGPGWENDKVGFRNYFDERNGFDIFGKTTSEMVLDRVGIDEDYHVMQEWGMDNLRVGASLGAGGMAMLEEGTLHRLTVPSSERQYELVVDGPLRSIFRMKFDDWMVDDNAYNLVHEITIWCGAWFYESNVTLSGIEGEKTLVAGITTIDLIEKRFDLDDSFEQVVFLATHDRQGYDGEFLGMAIMLEQNHYNGHGWAPESGADVVQSVYVEMLVRDNLPVNYRFYACWEHSDKNFRDKSFFLDLLKEEAFKMDNPVLIRPAVL